MGCGASSTSNRRLLTVLPAPSVYVGGCCSSITESRRSGWVGVQMAWTRRRCQAQAFECCGRGVVFFQGGKLDAMLGGWCCCIVSTHKLLKAVHSDMTIEPIATRSTSPPARKGPPDRKSQRGGRLLLPCAAAAAAPCCRCCWRLLLPPLLARRACCWLLMAVMCTCCCCCCSGDEQSHCGLRGASVAGAQRQCAVLQHSAPGAAAAFVTRVLHHRSWG